MTTRMPVRRYCELVFLVGIAVAVVRWRDLHLLYLVRHPVLAGMLSIGVVLAELMPVKVPMRGENEEITLSSPFVMALLVSGGLGPALAAQVTASAIQDLIARKPLWRVRFNCGQYSISLVAAFAVLQLLGGARGTNATHPFSAGQLPVLVISAFIYFVINTALVGAAVALFQKTSISRYFRSGLAFISVTAGLLLLLAPIVIAVAAYSPVLIPLLAAPVLVTHAALWQGARSERAARHDPLTGLPNRFAFHDAVERSLGAQTGLDALLLMDLDRFKEVNDTLGHHHGDLLLQQVAHRLRDALGAEDHIARLGGDEFAILTLGCTRESAKLLARQVADSLRAPFDLEGTVVDVQASLGIALYPSDGEDVETLLQKADVAMYHAKEHRSGCALYEDCNDHNSPGRLTLAAELRVGLRRDEIIAHFQPELDLTSGRIVGVEALARWAHPERGPLLPGAFVEIAERTGLIRPLTSRILELALAQVAEWNRLGYELNVAVNISASVLGEQDFVPAILAVLDRHGVSPRHLTLEVTESVLMTQPEITRGILRDLNAHGIEIAIDDFGTGYSSLSYLADLPASVVKIDRSFVSRMQNGDKEAIIVSSTIDLAHHLGMRAVAEGVEDAEELLRRLRGLGCDSVQGFAIGRPVSGLEMTRFLLQHREGHARRSVQAVRAA
jgi:diguanylate cyclase (GGDEF)-like protein